jgi:hypothetical protein
MIFLSKSKYLAGLQCSKLLWYYYNAKDQIPAPDAGTQAIFEQGHEVGELAKSLFPGGIEVAKGIIDFDQVVPKSLEAIKIRKPLFEAAFRYKNAFARADVLNPVGKDQWDIIEVKSSTEVKDINLHDLALQRYTYEGAGLKVRKCLLMYINNEYVRRGDIDPRKLLAQEDVTKLVAELLPQVQSNLNKMVDVIRLRKHPEISIGPQCSNPYECPLKEMCWDFLPDNNVFTLYRLGQKGFDLLNEGVQKIVDIPADYRLSGVQKIQLASIRNRRPSIDKPAIKAFLTSLKYPLYYLDFETLNTAIPLFDDVRPYQQVPFQFSLHIVTSDRAKPVHHSFLADGSTDPRPEILQRLQSLLGKEGSIVAYNAGFEKRIMKESSDVFHKYASWYEKLEQRFVDLLQPFRSFHYYHPDQQGSASIKAVLPALTGKSYEGMEIADGGVASREYLRVTFTNTPAGERANVRRQLENYCGLDTSAMSQIVNKLRDLSA